MSPDHLLNIPDERLVLTISCFPSLLTYHDELKKRVTNEIQVKIQSAQNELNALSPKDRTLYYIKNFLYLDEYDFLNKLSHKEWVIQIVIRATVYSDLKIAEIDPELYESMKDIYAPTLFKILHASSLHINYSNLFDAPYLGLDPSKPTLFHSVRETHLGEAYEGIKNNTTNSSFSALERIFNLPFDERYKDKDYEVNNISIDNHMGEGKKDYKGFLNQFIHPSINLHYSDKQIINDFKKYLETMRGITAIYPLVNRPITKSNTQTWIDHKVLQYIDLLLLDMFINDKPTLKQSTISNILFPEIHGGIIDKDPIEKLRRSTIPNAKKILQYQFTDEYAAQAVTDKNK